MTFSFCGFIDGLSSAACGKWSGYSSSRAAQGNVRICWVLITVLLPYRLLSLLVHLDCIISHGTSCTSLLPSIRDGVSKVGARKLHFSPDKYFCANICISSLQEEIKYLKTSKIFLSKLLFR